MKSPRFATALLVVLFLVSGLSAKAQNEESLLWKVSGKDLPAPSYLFGTMHLVCKADVPLSPSLRQAIAASEALVMEMDLSDPQVAQQAMMGGLNPGMKNIAEELSEADQQLINDFLREHYTMDLNQVGVFKPFIIMTMVIPSYLDCETTSMEEEVMALALPDSLPLIGLEDARFQLSLFDSLPHAEMMELMVSTFREFEEDKQDFVQMTEDYAAGRLTALYEQIIEDPSMRVMRERLLDSRNRNWVPLLEAAMQERPVMVAVGAGHLAGGQGLIALLRAQGYTVEAVKD